MRVTFWGVRGSYPVPGTATVRYGGHTSCVQIDIPGKAPFVLDAGTGMRDLGRALRTTALGHGEGHVNLFLTHLHWDHIQGLPFFEPVFSRGNRLNVWARSGRGTKINEAVSGVAGDAVFPIRFQELPANFRFASVRPGEDFDVDGVRVRPFALNHPGTATGYRLDFGGASVAYITDTSPFDRIRYKKHFSKGPPKVLPAGDRKILNRMRRDLVEAVRGVDVAIYDTSFTDAEYEKLPHWGHSTPAHALEIVKEAEARSLVLFHHAPNRSDDEMDQILAQTREAAAGSGIPVEAARQGLTLEAR